jgi:cell division protein FtsQ
MALILKRGTLFLLAAVFIAGAVLGLKMLAQQFNVKEIVISGNYHLERDEILGAMKITRGKSLMKINLEDIGDGLEQNPWIKQVAVRKQYPHSLVVKIDEAVPKALLSMNKQLFLLDKEGSILESIKGETVPFLPVIKDINPKNRKGITEALKLVEALSGRADVIERESIEIGLETYGLTVTLDGEFIKVGYGKYSEKLARWIELEPEIRKRGVPIKYVDLRFKDSVIVKPLKEKKGEKSS